MSLLWNLQHSPVNQAGLLIADVVGAGVLAMGYLEQSYLEQTGWVALVLRPVEVKQLPSWDGWLRFLPSFWCWPLAWNDELARVDSTLDQDQDIQNMSGWGNPVDQGHECSHHDLGMAGGLTFSRSIPPAIDRYWMIASLDALKLGFCPLRSRKFTRRLGSVVLECMM